VYVVDDHALVREGPIIIVNLEPDLQVIGSRNRALETVAEIKRLRPRVLVTDLSAGHSRC
jgi:DNA-binding NarL/FixJ family response regulator